MPNRDHPEDDEKDFLLATLCCLLAVATSASAEWVWQALVPPGERT